MKNKLGIGEIVRTEYGTEFIYEGPSGINYSGNMVHCLLSIDPFLDNCLMFEEKLYKKLKPSRSTIMQDVDFYLSRGLDFNLWEVYRSKRLKELGV